MRYLIIAFLLMLLQTSCKKLVEVKSPVTSVGGSDVYTDDATAAAVLTGIYTNICSNAFSGGGFLSMSLFPGLSADELLLYNGTTNTIYIDYYTNKLTNTNTGGSDFWNNIYPTIYVTNSAIESLSNSKSLTPAVKQQLAGEARFIRAFCYFYLVSLYGDVPLVTVSDYTINATLPRTSTAKVWQQIISDLQEAKMLLRTDYMDATASRTTTERVRPNRWTASALLARVYLYTGDWKNAKAEADSIINMQGTYGLDSNMNDVFLKNNPEAIWQLQPVNYGQNTQDALQFILPSSGPDPFLFPFYLSNNLVNSFEPGDMRRTNWVDSVIAGGTTYYYAYKYKVNTLNVPLAEYEMVLRLGEQYLIRAEAKAQLRDLSGAKDDLNKIRGRAGLGGTNAQNQTDLLAAILQERRVELFTEWGHRWLDMKRTNTANAIMSIVAPEKGGKWNSNWQLYPIPLASLQTDPNITQNAGY